MTLSPWRSVHSTSSASPVTSRSASRDVAAPSSNTSSSASVGSKLYFRSDFAKSSSVAVSVEPIHAGIHATSCARCPSGNDFSCGFHSPCSVGTRASSRRVASIS